MDSVTIELVNPRYVIAVSRPAEVAWWPDNLAVSGASLIEAVKAVGAEAGRVCSYLRKPAGDLEHSGVG